MGLMPLAAAQNSTDTTLPNWIKKMQNGGQRDRWKIETLYKAFNTSSKKE